MIEKSYFDRHPCGIAVYAYILKTSALEVKILSYGGIINSIKLKDKDGIIRDVVGGFDKIIDYIDSGEYQGAIIGRVCNRLKNASFRINGQNYRTYPNEGNNVCHAGRFGFNAKLWDVESIDGDEPEIILSYTSPDGEEGFPGELKAKVSYKIVSGNKLVIKYTATTDKTTIVNFTNHSYFNMNGYDNGSTENQIIRMNADRITDTDSELIPTGENISVDATGFDLRREIRLGNVYNNLEPKIQELGGLDTNFVLNNYDGTVKHQADLISPETGIHMRVYTDQSSILVYTSNKIKETEPKMKNSVRQIPHFGACFEAAAMPDAINHANFDNTVLEPGDTYSQTTAFEFSLD